MAELLSSNFRTLAFGSVVLSLLYIVYYHLTTGARRRAIIRERGCLPVPRLASFEPFGFVRFQEARKAFRERRILDTITERFEELGSDTVGFTSLGRNIITTREPENIKQILSLDFKNWSLGSNRIANFTPFFGPGIFTTDGAAWQHSRDMLRPSFTRNQVRDLESLDNHVQHLIDAVARDGSTVDLQPLFFRLTIDSATDFLFGESTNTLAPGLATVSASRFAQCFNRGQEALAERGRFGPFAFLAPTKEFDDDAKFVHGEHPALRNVTERD